MSNYLLDGKLFKLIDFDIDNQYTNVSVQDESVSEIKEVTELSETLKEMNSDVVDSDTRMSSIDVKARLSLDESSGVLAYDTLVALKFLPKIALFLTRQRKRLSVSEEGKGRLEAVSIAQSQRQHKESKSFMGKIGNMFGKKEAKE